MFAAGVQGSFRCRHVLPLEGGQEAVPHAHDYTVAWECWTDRLDAKGYAADIARMRASLDELCRRMDGQFLDDLDFFRDRTQSVENLGIYMTGELRASLGAAAGPRDTP